MRSMEANESAKEECPPAHEKKMNISPDEEDPEEVQNLHVSPNQIDKKTLDPGDVQHLRVLDIDGESQNDSIGEAPGRSSVFSVDTWTGSHNHTNCLSSVSNWSKERKMLAVFGCLSSTLVCVVRLMIDPGYQTYTIHSIIVFFDMVLIHLFTASKWLSATGESITILSFLLYHYTKQKVWELLETTLLAMICSFHMILSRSDHWDREEELEGLIGLEIIAHDDGNATKTPSRSVTVDKRAASNEEQNSINADTTMIVQENKRKHDLRRCSHRFFEHFLDGAAGVMYTSFLGLIVDEFIIWGSSEVKE